MVNGRMGEQASGRNGAMLIGDPLAHTLPTTRGRVGEGAGVPARFVCVLLVALLLVGCSLPGGGVTSTVAPPTAPATAAPPIAAIVAPTATSAVAVAATATVLSPLAPTATAPLPTAPPAPPPTSTTIPTLAPTIPPPTASPPTAPPTAPLPTALPTATAAPIAPKLTKLTADGCCAQPLWTADGGAVFYYGYGGANGQQLGTWAVPRGGGATRPFAPVYGTFSPSRRLVATRAGAVTTVARADGTPLGTLTTGAALVFLAPTDDRIAWIVPAAGIPQVSSSLEPPARVRVATIGPEGIGAARTLDPIIRAEVLAWLPDGRRLVLSTRDAAGLNGGIAVLDTATGAIRQIVAGNFLESLAVSPDGSGVVYTAVLQPTAAENGVWYVRLDGTGRRKLPISGGYRWLPDGRGLAFIPAPSNLPTDELRYYALADGTTRPLATAQQARFLVASNDWELAPDGRAIVFRSATDGAIWMLELGP